MPAAVQQQLLQLVLLLLPCVHPSPPHSPHRWEGTFRATQDERGRIWACFCSTADSVFGGMSTVRAACGPQAAKATKGSASISWEVPVPVGPTRCDFKYANLFPA